MYLTFGRKVTTQVRRGVFSLRRAGAHPSRWELMGAAIGTAIDTVHRSFRYLGRHSDSDTCRHSNRLGGSFPVGTPPETESVEVSMPRQNDY